MTTAALFKTAKAHKQPNCPLRVGCTKKIVYIHNEILTSFLKKKAKRNLAMCDEVEHTEYYAMSNSINIKI